MQLIFIHASYGIDLKPIHVTWHFLRQAIHNGHLSFFYWIYLVFTRFWDTNHFTPYSPSIFLSQFPIIPPHYPSPSNPIIKFDHLGMKHFKFEIIKRHKFDDSPWKWMKRKFWKKYWNYLKTSVTNWIKWPAFETKIIFYWL